MAECLDSYIRKILDIYEWMYLNIWLTLLSNLSIKKDPFYIKPHLKSGNINFAFFSLPFNDIFEQSILQMNLLCREFFLVKRKALLPLVLTGNILSFGWWSTAIF